MGPVVSTKKLEAQAAEWLVRSEAASFSAEGRTALEEWLVASPRNRAVYMRLRAAWQQANQFRRLRPFDGEINADLLTESVLPSLKRTDRAAIDDSFSRLSLAWRRAITAALAALMLLGMGFAARAVMERSAWQIYTTDIGGFQRVSLRDGSTIHVNTNSQIRVRLTNGRREVLLDHGEALFAVAKDAHRPFDVEAGGTTIRAMGTVFSVRFLSRAKRVDVLVTEGTVTIDPSKQKPELTAAQSPPSSTLSAGETATITMRELNVAKVDAGKIALKTAWTKGQLLFEGQTVTEIACEFNRYNRRKLEIADPAIANLRINAGFDATSPEQFVETLERTYGARAVYSNEKGTDVVRLTGGG